MGVYIYVDSCISACGTEKDVVEDGVVRPLDELCGYGISRTGSPESVEQGKT